MYSVFMTGGAGFLGRAILRWAAKEHPDTRFTIYSRDEGKQTLVRQLFPQHRYVLGDVRDMDRLRLAMGGHDTVIHAAAMKYVPEAEVNVSEAIAVNVEGSQNVARAADYNRVDRVVGISTDKACRPVNVYGMTKLLMERVFLEHDAQSQTRFTLVRYGNVVGSTGSVVPIFRAQAREGRITLTNPSMTRFWLSTETAVKAVSMVLEHEESGYILIPRLPSCDMRTVAEAVAELELGSKEAGKVEYTVTGQRFGEKVHEELLTPIEAAYAHKTIGGLWMVLWPTTGAECVGHMDYPYSSNMPDRMLTKEDFMALVREAPE